MDPLTRLLDVGLWIAAAGHAGILVAGVSAPRALGWREELATLRPFTRKAFWVYYVFTGFTIVALGTLTALLHDEMLAGDRSAVALAAFMAAWWTARILVDAFVFSHADWPKGRGFKAGHVVLTAAFVALAATYTAVVLRALPA